MRSKLILLLSVIVLNGCGERNVKQSDKEGNKVLNEKVSVLFTALPSYAENPENPRSDAKIRLGKILFYDNGLSKENGISCNSCHNLNSFGVDNLPTSPGDDGVTFGTRNSPTVLNAALHHTQFWDGRAKDVEEQSGMPITNPVEMMMPDEGFVVNRVKSSPTYQELFKQAFPNEEDPINFKNLRFAIASFERTLMTPSKFDDFLGGNLSALNGEEIKGLETFINSGCVACHSGMAIGGGPLQKFPLFANYEELSGSEKIDKGKFESTKNEADAFLFKPQSLRNVEMTYPYFHDGGVKDLQSAVKFMAKLELNKEISDEEINSIIIFLRTLTADVPEEVKQIPVELKNLYL